MPRPKVHDESLRAELIREASRVVAHHGPGGLNLRSVAMATGTSTSAIYSLFGSKTGLVAAVKRAAFDSFAKSQHAVPTTGSAIDDLVALGVAYRDWALSQPNFYLVMFRNPEQVLGQETQSAMLPLISCVQRLVDEEVFRAPVMLIVAALWATVHGFLTLELEGFLQGFPDIEASFVAGIKAFAIGWSMSPQDHAVTLSEWLPPSLIRARGTGVA